jgi:hypothetical protein
VVTPSLSRARAVFPPVGRSWAGAIARACPAPGWAEPPGPPEKKFLFFFFSSPFSLLNSISSIFYAPKIIQMISKSHK